MSLTKQDRCDRCGAEAIHRFARKDQPDLDLLFCNHHTTEYLAPLNKQGFAAIESKELVAA